MLLTFLPGQVAQPQDGPHEQLSPAIAVPTRW